MRIAMWSGPRNLSTAMMYAFGNRKDFAAWDEPFYAAYLATTEIDHPLRAEVLKSDETDPESVAKRCAGPIPGNKPHFYMKHMPHHMLEGFPLDWASECVNVHLIRHPARVIASYAVKRASMTLDDIGFRQQAEIFERLPGPVVDSFDIRQDPEKALSHLCAEVGLPFDPAMLSWPMGPKSFDGIWASHWYNAVHSSTGFAKAEGPLPELSGQEAKLADASMEYYNEMRTRAG